MVEPFAMNDHYTVALITFVLAHALTYFAKNSARRFRFVANPKADRWHTRPTAMLGGTAIFVSTVSMYLIFVPYSAESIVVIAASSILFVVGIVDDLLHIKPYQKLIGQIIGASLVVGAG